MGIKPEAAEEFNQADKGTQLLHQAMMSKALRKRQPPQGGMP
jgi:hypothetical protein